MIAQIPLLLLGLLIAVMGVINMTGNINSLHSYHRHRVKEEDRLPFGRMVGSGTLTVGVGVIVFSVLMMILIFLSMIGLSRYDKDSDGGLFL